MTLRIYEKSESIRKYVKDLKSLNISSIEDLKNKEKYYASSMIVFSVINELFSSL